MAGKGRVKKLTWNSTLRKTKIMAYSHITSWQIERKKGSRKRFFLDSNITAGNKQGHLACCSAWSHKESDMTERSNWTKLKITANNNCSHEIKRHLLLGRKPMTNLYSILKSRDITLPTKVCNVKAMFFSSSHVQMWENWTTKVEHQRVLSNHSGGEDSWKSLELQGD